MQIPHYIGLLSGSNGRGGAPTGYAATGGGIDNYLGALRSRRLIRVPVNEVITKIDKPPTEPPVIPKGYCGKNRATSRRVLCKIASVPKLLSIIAKVSEIRIVRTL